MALKLQRLPEGQAIVDKDGRPALGFVVYWQQTCDAIETQESTQDEQLALIEEAQASADAAAAAALAAGSAVVVLDGTLATAEAAIVTLSGRVDGYDALAPFVREDQTAAWADSTGAQARTTFAAYAGQTVSNPPTQAEVQAIDDHVKVISEHLAALVNDLRANGTLT